MTRLENNLVVIENGKLTSYELDNKLKWTVGRDTPEKSPDISLSTLTVSREHGYFENKGGIWFYMDNYGKNGTVLNGKHLIEGLGGKVKPVMLADGDVLIFGGGEQAVINNKTVWAMFTEHNHGYEWRVEETKGYNELSFLSLGQEKTFDQPEKGTVVRLENGVAIYMGDITYINGDMTVKGK